MKRQQFPTLALACAVALLATACGKSEPESQKPRANAPLQIPEAKPDTKADNGEANEALKERLARQEAAAKLFDKSKPEPVKAVEPAPQRAAPPAKAPEPVRTAAAAPAVVQAPQKAPEIIPAKAVEPVKAPEPATAPRVELAAAKPAANPPAPAFTVAKLVSRIDPEFPREAVQAGADKGNVKARMTLDGNGNVTRVEVVEASPRRVFDRAVVRALSQWRFNDGPSGRTVETEVEFKLR